MSDKSHGKKSEALLTEKRLLGHLWSSVAPSYLPTKGPPPARVWPRVLQRQSWLSCFAKIGKFSGLTFIPGTFRSHYLSCLREVHRAYVCFDLCIF